ncbi:hypothetical protein ACLK1S_16775 [Escherichia coli]
MWDLRLAHSTAYTTSVESPLGIQVPERAQMIRAICWRWNAGTAPPLNLGLACHFTGFDSGFYAVLRGALNLHENGRDPYPWRANLWLKPDRRIRCDSLKDDMIQTRQAGATDAS